MVKYSDELAAAIAKRRKEKAKPKAPKKLVKPNVMKRIQKKVAKLGKEKALEKRKVGRGVAKEAKVLAKELKKRKPKLSPDAKRRLKAMGKYDSGYVFGRFTDEIFNFKKKFERFVVADDFEGAPERKYKSILKRMEAEPSDDVARTGMKQKAKKIAAFKKLYLDNKKDIMGSKKKLAQYQKAYASFYENY
tara:strand:+ start:380 stop:952 length:573 start_codon:yes stop_codon:yes gene_type:complete